MSANEKAYEMLTGTILANVVSNSDMCSCGACEGICAGCSCGSCMCYACSCAACNCNQCGLCSCNACSCGSCMCY